MGITFNADEVFEMAEEIERNGAKFYRQAAKYASSAEIKQMLLDMASMEDGHLQTFEQMRKELGKKDKAETVFDPDSQAALYLQALADGKGSEGMISPNQPLTGSEPIDEILKIAIEAEKRSVLFYVGLKDIVSARAGRDRIDDIIKEVVGHVAIIKKQLADL